MWPPASPPPSPTERDRGGRPETPGDGNSLIQLRSPTEILASCLFFERKHADAPNVGETTLFFANSRWLSLAGTKTKLKVSAKSGFATPGERGHLYEVHDTADAAKSRAIYVQEDQKMFKVTKDSAGNFTVLGALIP